MGRLPLPYGSSLLRQNHPLQLISSLSDLPCVQPPLQGRFWHQLGHTDFMAVPATGRIQSARVKKKKTTLQFSIQFSLSLFIFFFFSSLKTHKWLSSSPAWISFSQNFNFVNYTLDVAGCFWKPLLWSQSHSMCLSCRANGRNLSLVSYFGQPRIILAHTTITQIQACDQSKDELIKPFLVLVSANILISLPLSYFAV